MERNEQDGRMPCDYCRNGEVFRADQNCPKCGRRGLKSKDFDKHREARFDFGAELSRVMNVWEQSR